jgi:hypothetical protein
MLEVTNFKHRFGSVVSITGRYTRDLDVFSDRTKKVIFWEQFADDDKDFYCGG